MTKSWWRHYYLQRLAWIIILALVWEGIAISRVFNPLIFPPLAAIFKALVRSMASGEIFRTAGLSLLLIGEGLLIGTLLALILAALTRSSKLLQGLIETITVIAHPLPGIALLPLVILWVGTGTKAIVFIIIHSVLWPMLINALAGFKAIPRVYREVGENIGLTPLQTFWHVLIPASFPYLLSGLKISWARAWRAIISAEMVFGAAGGMGGLGWYIFQRRVFMDSAGIYAGIIVIILIGMIIEEVGFVKVEAITVRRWGMSL